MKRSVAALMLCVTIAGCSATSNGTPTGGPTIDTPSAGPLTYHDAATALATADGHPRRGQPYLAPVRAIGKFCRLTSPDGTVTVVRAFADQLAAHGLHVKALTVAQALASAARHGHGQCSRTFAAYLPEIVGTGPAKSPSGWGGYAGSVSAWDAVHHSDPSHPGQYLPRRRGTDAYAVDISGQVTSLVERFDPPVSAPLALAQIVHDLLPGTVHSVYTLHTGQCQQAIYLGPELGGLLHNSSLGAFVELTSGGGVGHTHYDDLRVNQARITPLGAVGGQPCS